MLKGGGEIQLPLKFMLNMELGVVLNFHKKLSTTPNSIISCEIFK